MDKVRAIVGFFVMGLIFGVPAWGVSGGRLTGPGLAAILVSGVLVLILKVDELFPEMICRTKTKQGCGESECE